MNIGGKKRPGNLDVSDCRVFQMKIPASLDGATASREKGVERIGGKGVKIERDIRGQSVSQTGVLAFVHGSIASTSDKSVRIGDKKVYNQLNIVDRRVKNTRTLALLNGAAFCGSSGRCAASTSDKGVRISEKEIDCTFQEEGFASQSRRGRDILAFSDGLYFRGSSGRHRTDYMALVRALKHGAEGLLDGWHAIVTDHLDERLQELLEGLFGMAKEIRRRMEGRQRRVRFLAVMIGTLNWAAHDCVRREVEKGCESQEAEACHLASLKRFCQIAKAG